MPSTSATRFSANAGWHTGMSSVAGKAFAKLKPFAKLKIQANAFAMLPELVIRSSSLSEDGVAAL